MPSTTTYRRGQVVVVEVPFSDSAGVKLRPALIVSAAAFHRDLLDVIVCPVSSQPRYYHRPGVGDCPLTDWRRVGLRYPSTVRVSKLLAVDKRIVRRALGVLSARDLAQVASTLRAALALP